MLRVTRRYASIPQEGDMAGPVERRRGDRNARPTGHPDAHVLRAAHRDLGPVADRLCGADPPRPGVQAGRTAARGRGRHARAESGGLTSRLFVAAVPPPAMREQLASYVAGLGVDGL